jgi:26S proteasome regulatory subunit N10
LLKYLLLKKLVLKHRQNKNQRQRVIVFVGSPVEEDEKSLVKLGKKLKKNNVAVDVISFGQETENQQKLTLFVEAVNNSDNSHLVTIPPGPHLLSDILMTSPIIQGEDGPPPGFGGGNFEFGVDPSLDPELAMVYNHLIRLLKCLWMKNALDKEVMLNLLQLKEELLKWMMN